MPTRAIPVLLAALAATSVTLAQDTPPKAHQPSSDPRASDSDPVGGSTIELLREEAGRSQRLVACDAVRQWMLASNWLPFVDTRRVYFNRADRKACSQDAWEKLPEQERGNYKLLELDDRFYYYTRYGSPFAYARPLDLAAAHLGCAKDGFAKRRIADFGYGGIGHLRLLASIGADVVGVDVDPVLKELYSQPGDTGKIAGVGMSEPKAPDGNITLACGQWPGDPAVKAAVGSNLDLFISKNTLKRGYIHPSKEVDKRMLVDLGVDDATFVREVASALKSGGIFLIYNICPKQNEEKYIPWADGQCPFTRELLEKEGFEVLEFDHVDNEAVRKLGSALAWDRGENPMDLENDTFAWYTLARKK
ncbi:MAG: hypothetical protein JSR77_14050 [Planctomycetes bacterium]|nr:hypothetical protein [Planctomycetota bacterium]